MFAMTLNIILIMHSTKSRQFNHAVVINEGWCKLLRYICSMWGGHPEATLEVSLHSPWHRDTAPLAR